MTVPALSVSHPPYTGNGSEPHMPASRSHAPPPSRFRCRWWRDRSIDRRCPRSESPPPIGKNQYMDGSTPVFIFHSPPPKGISSQVAKISAPGKLEKKSRQNVMHYNKTTKTSLLLLFFYHAVMRTQTLTSVCENKPFKSTFCHIFVSCKREVPFAARRRGA